MRRSVPSKRNYQVMLAVDNSKSMMEGGAGALALESLALLCKSLSMLEVGEICVLGFGDEEHVRVAQPFAQTFTSEWRACLFTVWGASDYDMASSSTEKAGWLPEMTKDFEGAWDGTLDAGGKSLRLSLKLAAAPDGTATATLVSIDQNSQQIPVTTVTIENKELRFEARGNGYSSKYSHNPVPTAASLDTLKAVNEALTRVPAGFTPHPNIVRTVLDKQRAVVEKNYFLGIALEHIQRQIKNFGIGLAQAHVTGAEKRIEVSAQLEALNAVIIQFPGFIVKHGQL